MLSFGLARLSQAFGEDIQSRNAPFNAAAADKYCAEYTLRALAARKMRREFNSVAANLAYDNVAESADAAELFAEMTALATDMQTAEGLANGAQFYFVAGVRFSACRRAGRNVQPCRRQPALHPLVQDTGLAEIQV